jgi:hypothetical protein
MRIIERFLVGNVIKDFGTIGEKSIGIGKIKYSAMLAEKHGILSFVIKSSVRTLFGSSDMYQDITLDTAVKLKEYLTESETIAKNVPPLNYDVAQIAFRYSLITMAVAIMVNLLTQDFAIMALAMIVAFLFHLYHFVEFRHHPDVDAKTKRLLIIFPLITFLVSIPRFCYYIFTLLSIKI